MPSLEICVREDAVTRPDELRDAVQMLWSRQLERATPREGELLDTAAVEGLSKSIHHIRVCDLDDAVDGTVHLYLHSLYDEEPAEETAEGDESTVAFQMWSLPALPFDGLWETLLFEEDVKKRLLRYVSSSVHFASMQVDSQVIAWNRVVLLHGPPGTGKTSLCRGLAHKLSIRLSGRYRQSHLLEINAHSLFSKWFSESGKMVMSMFARVTELLEEGDAFVTVLIDEVESLSAARQAAVSGGEPSDAVRVVNALLTQLDQLRRFPNVIVLATSNLMGAIDPAFIDRADLKLYIGPPGVSARYDILSSCVSELCRARIVSAADTFLSLSSLTPLLPEGGASYEMLRALPTESGARSQVARQSMVLHAIAAACDGLSGRALRKLPFLAHALYLREGARETPVDEFLEALHKAVLHERQARRDAGLADQMDTRGNRLCGTNL